MYLNCSLGRSCVLLECSFSSFATFKLRRHSLICEIRKKQNRREMSWQDSDKAPVTFHDVVACFSEDEWNLLHKWQKELYRNVMMEIHQALTSLGPLIAASIFSLRVKENDDVCPFDRPDPEKSHSIKNFTNGAAVNPDVLCRVSRQETLHLKSHKGTDGRAKSDCHITGASVVTRRMKEGDSLKETEVITPWKASLRKIKANCPHNTDLETASKSFLSSESNAKGRGIVPTEYKGDFSNLKHYNLHPGAIDVEMQDTSNSNKHNVNHEDHPKYQPNIVQSWRMHTSEDCEERLCGTGNISSSQITESSECPQEQADYKNSFGFKQCEYGHKQAHSEDKSSVAGPYLCTQCGKTFSIKGSLLRHQKAHAGVRYACSECDKSFTQKGDLTIHQRTHAGKNPYTCTYCQKCFSSKCNLNQHKRKHIGQCTEYYPNMA
ncbi:zinc finger protein 2-like isoform X2 [Pleurodeles waltl]|uniref:zinc finger protein 2-like isoform X2 n=1 Tax=Pleurodeles waltl TaxID=8319 RepID=UPI00370990CC